MFNYTPLHNAVVANNVEYVKMILEFPNVDVNSQSLKVDTPLHFAACFNHVESVRMLIKHPKIDPNAVGCVFIIKIYRISFCFINSISFILIELYSSSLCLCKELL